MSAGKLDNYHYFWYAFLVGPPLYWVDSEMQESRCEDSTRQRPWAQVAFKLTYSAMQFSEKIGQIIGWGPPSRAGVLVSGKSWIRHWSVFRSIWIQLFDKHLPVPLWQRKWENSQPLDVLHKFQLLNFFLLSGRTSDIFTQWFSYPIRIL